MLITPNIKSITKVGLVVSVVVLAYFAGRNSAIPVQADSGTYGYLAVQSGNTENGGKHVVDLRTAKMWVCTYKECTLEGRMPFEQIK